MTRRCKDGFLKRYLEYHQDTEIPEYFALWCGVFCISACLTRKCKIEFRPTIYPNLFVILVAASGHCRKSTAIGTVEKLLTGLDNPVKVYAQKGTPVGLIQALKEVELDDKGKIKNSGAQGALIVDEVGTFLDRQAYTNGMIPLLTTLWDSKDSPFVYQTVGRGKEILQNTCVSFLGGTTADWLKTAIPAEAVGGGFTSRIIFVSSKQTPHAVFWPRDTPTSKKIMEELKNDLNEIRKISGVFTPTAEAKDMFEEVYIRYRNSAELLKNCIRKLTSVKDEKKHEYLKGEIHDLERITNLSQDSALSGYMSRRSIQLLKISMCVSASLRNSRTITINDLQIANELLTKTELSMPGVIKSITTTKSGEDHSFVLERIKQYGRIQRSALVRKCSHKLTVYQIEEIITTLVEERLITTSVENRSMYYIYKKGK